jgi:hypothetical protein
LRVAGAQWRCCGHDRNQGSSTSRIRRGCRCIVPNYEYQHTSTPYDTCTRMRHAKVPRGWSLLVFVALSCSLRPRTCLGGSRQTRRDIRPMLTTTLRCRWSADRLRAIIDSRPCLIFDDSALYEYRQRAAAESGFADWMATMLFELFRSHVHFLLLSSVRGFQS